MISHVTPTKHSTEYSRNPTAILWSTGRSQSPADNGQRIRVDRHCLGFAGDSQSHVRSCQLVDASAKSSAAKSDHRCVGFKYDLACHQYCAANHRLDRRDYFAGGWNSIAETETGRPEDHSRLCLLFADQRHGWDIFYNLYHLARASPTTFNPAERSNSNCHDLGRGCGNLYQPDILHRDYLADALFSESPACEGSIRKRRSRRI